MKLTALHVARLAAEFARAFTGAKLTGLHKSEADKTVRIDAVNADSHVTLIYYFGPEPLLYYATDTPERIGTTNFLPQLRNGHVREIAQAGFDRVLRMAVATPRGEFALIFELLGSRNNLILVDSEARIITSVKRRRAAERHERYVFPPSLPLADPLTFDAADIASSLMSAGDLKLAEVMQARIAGLTEADLRQLMNLHQLSADTRATDLHHEQLKGLLNDLQTVCRAFVRPDSPVYYDPTTFDIRLSSHSLALGSRQMDSLAEYYRLLPERPVPKARAEDPRTGLLRDTQRLLKTERGLVQRLTERVSQARSWEQLQKQAQLLTLNIQRLQTGMGMVEVEDTLVGDGLLKVSLNPRLSPGRNIEQLFERAKKLKSALPKLKAELDAAVKRALDLERLIENLRTPNQAADLVQLRANLRRLGLDSQPTQRGKAAKAGVVERLPYREFQTPAGEAIWIGKTAADNEVLTFKLANKIDLWLHAQQATGSHVILRRPGRKHEFSPASILEAASLAAYYSTARNSDAVPVVYTEVKFVRKARKGAPGRVVYDHAKSVLVRPRTPVK